MNSTAGRRATLGDDPLLDRDGHGRHQVIRRPEGRVAFFNNPLGIQQPVGIFTVVAVAAECFELTSGYIGLILAACPSPFPAHPFVHRSAADLLLPSQGPDDTHPYSPFPPTTRPPARRRPPSPLLRPPLLRSVVRRAGRI